MNIAGRFLFSPKSHSIVNLIARVSVVAIAIPVVALVVVLSLHNGLSDYIHSMYGSIDAPIEVRSAEGATFEVDSLQYTALTERVGVVSRMVEGNVLARVEDRQLLVALRGVDSLYGQVSDVEQTISRGRWQLDFAGMPRAVLGAGVSYDLAYSLAAPQKIELYALQLTPPMLSFMPIPFFTQREIIAAGVFALDQSTDASIVYVPIDFASELLSMNDRVVSALEILPRPEITIEKAKTEIAQIIGAQVVSRDSEEQRGDIFRVINVEKWVIMLMLVCVAMIAAMSLTGCMLMMLSEKQQATRTLQVMGMTGRKLRGAFVRLGMMIVSIGLGSGLVLGVVLVGVQYYFGVMKMGGESFLIDSYPVRLAALDLLIITLSVATISYFIIRLTVNSVLNKN
ncbi:MAG: ABC transporter permease [Mucinivorans sp.]